MISQIHIPSFYGQYSIPKNPAASYRPTQLSEIYQWFLDNPTATITVDELIAKFQISSPGAYRVQRILLAEGKIHKHKFSGRKGGIQYGLHPQLEIPTAKDIKKKPSLGTRKNKIK